MAVAPGHAQLHAINILHRDSFSAKVSGLCPVLASGNTTSLYCRAVISHLKPMTIFNPSMSERSTEDLVFIANGTEDTWQSEAIIQAKNELDKRGISFEQQQKIISTWEQQNKEYEDQQNEWLKSNETKKYKLWQMIVILIGAPFILLGFTPAWEPLSELNHHNFKIKFKQRLILLILGTSLWIGYSITVFKIEENRRLQEIEATDISDWEKNRLVQEE